MAGSHVTAHQDHARIAAHLFLQRLADRVLNGQYTGHESVPPGAKGACGPLWTPALDAKTPISAVLASGSGDARANATASSITLRTSSRILARSSSEASSCVR